MGTKQSKYMCKRSFLYMVRGQRGQTKEAILKMQDELEQPALFNTCFLADLCNQTLIANLAFFSHSYFM